MRILSIALLVVCAVTGCQSGSGRNAETAGAPKLITELTDQTTIYTCPACHMEFDRAGQCSMCHVDLVETQVEYICPADNHAVERAGKCPRCEMNARVVKTAMAAKPAAGASSGQ